MEEKRIGICQMLAEMLENEEISQEEEGKIRELFEERENRRAEIRIACDLLKLLQKEVSQGSCPDRMQGYAYGMGVPDNLGMALYQARIKNGITQQQLSMATGVNQADISRIERGSTNPSLSTLKKLADGLEMDLNIEFL